ncbi:hypothetical protein [Loigolactobacillus backii]|uniref:Uncharacterized protein n=1 Tax=Loigolactobacillus backii TaxID=375175 RepID=A0A192H067_9LACO|nr:hypothetical protein [Loigolactobacillus backii]ANK61361.1 hypothetical protein AYR53_00475 [Loigolactobacillus backii]ANK69439.1 hypothetical protein AYR56_04240 [Loigolactobacillus backii]MDA5387423.1 hypothetical protein [Loigolactobacillus backii]MDA5389962.1 hypothetical protein [Loigolactobacillus backii]PIO84064.1 hypothetical protein BSQ39_11090 [Loigolactobacillus backii]
MSVHNKKWLYLILNCLMVAGVGMTLQSPVFGAKKTDGNGNSGQVELASQSLETKRPHLVSKPNRSEIRNLAVESLPRTQSQQENYLIWVGGGLVLIAIGLGWYKRRPDKN